MTKGYPDEEIVFARVASHIDIDKPNPQGSAISLRHPFGCIGARQMVTVLYQIQHAGLGTGLTVRIGGGWVWPWWYTTTATEEPEEKSDHGYFAHY